MGGLPEKESRTRGRKEGWIKELERLEGCGEVVTEGRMERQKEEGEAGQREGRDKPSCTNGKKKKNRLDTVKRKL